MRKPIAWMKELVPQKGLEWQVVLTAHEEMAKDWEQPVIPLYTKQEWVGLTDEDMNNALDYWSDDSRSSYGGAHAANGEYVDMIETWRYIEAKLKEKNT